jgi:membrane-bound serine protease (ClpP class)
VLQFLTLAPVQVLLILTGLVMLFLEINTPGFGLSGLAAILCFLAVFGSSAYFGRVGSLEILLFCAGIVFVAVEIFVLPGFGFMGIAGFLLMGFALVLSMQEFIIPQTDADWNLLGRNALVVLIGMIAAITVIAIIVLLGPRIRLFDRLTLTAKITGTSGGPDVESGGQNETAAPKPADEAVIAGEKRAVFADPALPEPGATGSAITTLRPSGKAEIAGEVYPVEADGVFIEKGETIKVARIFGNRITVIKGNY